MSCLAPTLVLGPEILVVVRTFLVGVAVAL